MNPKVIVNKLIHQSSDVNSIAELERKLDISNGTISKWDKSKPGTQQLIKVADYFNASADYLLGRTDNPRMNDAKDDVLLAAHITDDVTEEEMEEIKNFIEFLKSKRGD